MLQCHFICCYQSHKINKSWFNQLKRLFIFVCQPTDLCFQMFIQFLPSKLGKKSDDRKGEKYETQEQRNPDIEFLLEINLQEMARGIKVRMVQCTIWIYIYLATVTLRRLFFSKITQFLISLSTKKCSGDIGNYFCLYKSLSREISLLFQIVYQYNLITGSKVIL